MFTVRKLLHEFLALVRLWGRINVLLSVQFLVVVGHRPLVSLIATFLSSRSLTCLQNQQCQPVLLMLHLHDPLLWVLKTHVMTLNPSIPPRVIQIQGQPVICPSPITALILLFTLRQYIHKFWELG